MVCRLCLVDLNEENAIALFETKELYSENQIAKLIAKYIQLELSQDDPVSTSICQDCSEHLEVFHQFWLYVDQKQSTLRNEFLEVEYDEDILSEEDNEESLQDFKNISMEFVEVAPVEKFRCTIEIDENNVEEVNTCAAIAALIGSSPDSVDDNTPVTPKTRSKTKKPNKSKVSTKRETRSKKVSKVKRQEDTDEEGSESESNARNPDLYKCNICDKQFRSEVGLQKHKKLHLTNNDEVKSKSGKNRTCKIRNESLLTAPRLRLRKGIFQNDNDYPCDICSKSFVTDKCLRYHIGTVHNQIWHNCDICGKKFNFKKTLKKHLLEHQGIVESPAQCDICSTWLKNKRSLYHHRLMHDTAQYDCTICGRKYVNRFALNKHIIYMHRLKYSLQCQYCEKSFKIQRNLEEHVAMHTGELLYSCPHCSKEFRSKSNMYVHIKRVHTEEWLQSKAERSNDPNVKSQLK